MKSSYIDRAKKFIAQIFPYVDGIHNSVYAYERAVRAFNADHHRKVELHNGAVRVVFVTSDYVVKLVYDTDNEQDFGGNQDEIEVYEMACEDGYEHLLAEPTMFHYQERDWLIMPRIYHRGDNAAWYGLSNDERRWLDNYIYDIHEYNFGSLHGHLVVFDYACHY